MNYLFFKLTNLRIFRSTYWARIFIVIFQGILLLPVYILLLKAYLGCDDFNALNHNGTLKWLYALIALVLLLINYFYYNLDRIKRIDREYRNYKGLRSYVRLSLIILLFILWMLKAGDLIRLFVEVPSC